MTAVLEAICAARNPRSALNWLRKGAGAAILADIVAGGAAATHEALDEHPRPRAAGFLRQVLTAGGVLAPGDEELTRAEQWLAGLLESLDIPGHRRLVHASATWQVMRRLRHNAQARSRQRTRTAAARNSISEATRFLAWLSGRGTTLRQCRQADIDEWLATASASASESTRGFPDWAARHGHCQAFAFPARQRHGGTAISDSQRREHATRLPRDDTIEPADRAAGCLVLLYGQDVTRIAALTASQVTRHNDEVHIRLGSHDIPIPPALGTILDTLITHGKPCTGTGTGTGTGTPEHSKWLFPGLLPRTADHSRTSVRTAQRHRHLRQSRPQGRPRRPHRPGPRRRTRRRPRHPPDHSSHLDTQRRIRLEPVRSRASQKPKSQTRGIANPTA